jgi:hypothetical protein
MRGFQLRQNELTRIRLAIFADAGTPFLAEGQGSPLFDIDVRQIVVRRAPGIDHLSVKSKKVLRRSGGRRLILTAPDKISD